jgi:hypothetical protein
MTSIIQEPIRVTDSVQQVRGESFSRKLRKSLIDSPLLSLIPNGATLAFHNTEYSFIMSLLHFSGSDRVPTKIDKAQLVFDWSKTGISTDEHLSASCNLPDRESAISLGGIPFGRESLHSWFNRIQDAFPDAINHAKFFHSMREEYRVAYLGSLVQDVFRSPNSGVVKSNVFVLGNGYPERVCGSSHSLLSVAPTHVECISQARLLVHSIGGKLVEGVEVVGGGLQLSLGMTNLYIVTDEAFRSLRFNPNRYNRPSLSITGMRYLGVDSGVKLTA